jgi:hypothetical protein
VNNVFAIYNTSFGHVTNAEPMEQFWARPSCHRLLLGVDPKAHYDNVTRKWYVIEVATVRLLCPGSAVSSP